jgi:hypothetical protein
MRVGTRIKITLRRSQTLFAAKGERERGKDIELCNPRRPVMLMMMMMMTTATLTGHTRSQRRQKVTLLQI